MPRVRSTALAFAHDRFGEATRAWTRDQGDSSMNRYLVRHGVAHLLWTGRKDEAQQRLLDLHFMAALCDEFDTFVQPLKYWRAVGDGEEHWGEVAEGLGALDSPTESLCEDLGTVARFCASCGWDQVAVALARAGLRAHELLYDDEPEEIASALGDLAYCLSQVDQAETLEVLRRQLALLEQFCPPGDKRLLPCLHGIAVCMEDSDESLQLNQRVLEQANLVHGPDSKHTLSALQVRAGILANLGRSEESEQLHREALERRTALFGPADPGTVHTTYSLASVLCNTGRFQEANALYDQVLAQYEQNYGCLNPKAKRLFESLALDRVDKGEEAIDMAQRVLARRKSTFGIEDIRTLWTQERLAMILDVLGRSEEASTLLWEVLSVGTRMEDVGDLALAWTRLNLARAEVALDHTEEAVRLYQEVLRIFEAEWGADDEDVLEVREELAALV